MSTSKQPIGLIETQMMHYDWSTVDPTIYYKLYCILYIGFDDQSQNGTPLCGNLINIEIHFYYFVKWSYQILENLTISILRTNILHFYNLVYANRKYKILD